MASLNKTHLKINYPECSTEGHSQEPLSRLCIDDKCQNKTIICCVCEWLDHKNHKTIPVKNLLQLLQKSSYENEGINALYFANSIDQLRENHFATLKKIKSQISQLLEDLETKGNMYFNKCEETMLSLIKMNNPLAYFGNSEMNLEQKSAKNIKDYFRKLLTIVNLEDKEGLSLKKKLDSLVESCKEKQKKINENLALLLSDLEKNSKKSLSLLEEGFDLSVKFSQFRWSETLKGAKIKINDLFAEQTNMESSGQRFGMMEPSLSQTGKMRWGIRVKKFVGWVGLGICLRNVIKGANFFFNYTNIGHGSYLISSNGYSWSHSVKEFNSAFKTFQFAVNDVVYLEYDPKDNKLRFKKNAVGTDKFELDIVPPPLGDAYNPCVNLCSTGDSVEIVLPGIPLS